MLHHHTAPVSIQAHKGLDVLIPVSTSPAILSHFFARYSPSSPQTGSLSQLLRLPAAQKRRAVAFFFPGGSSRSVGRARSRLHSAHTAQSRLRPGPRGERPWGGLRAPPAWSAHPRAVPGCGLCNTEPGAAGVSATCLAPPEPACPRPQGWLWQ